MPLLPRARRRVDARTGRLTTLITVIADARGCMACTVWLFQGSGVVVGRVRLYRLNLFAIHTSRLPLPVMAAG